MAGTGVGKFSSTAGNNTSNMTTNFAENMAPSNVNNAARELMGHIYDMYKQLGDGYFEFGDGDASYTVARSDADTITITSSSDISSIYFPGRKIRITDGGANVVEGTIASSSHTSTTQTVNLTGISLASGTPTKVELGIDTAAFGGRIILDDDGDTYIEAPTDDQIDIYIGGAKDFEFAANQFKVLSGSSISFATNSIAYFGDGNNLQISSDGTNANIAESGGSGNLVLSGQTIRLAKSDGEIMLEATNDAGVDIRHNHVTKFETTATGIDVTGTVTSDGADLDGAVVINESSANVDFRVESNNKTHALFVDGGNDRIGVGTDSPVQTMHIRSMGSPSNDTGLILEGNATDSNVAIYFYNSAGTEKGRFLYDTDDNNLQVNVNGSERMRLHSAGNVSIGTTDDHAKLTVMSTSSGSGANSDADELQIEGSGNAGMTIASGSSSSGNIHFADVGAANVGIVTYDHSSNQMKFGTSGSIKSRIDTSGNVIVAKSSASGGNTVGIELSANGQGLFTRDGGTVMNVTRNSDDGELIKFIQDGSLEGSISVSGTTVSYGGFTGTHWSRLADNSKPTILRGTIMDSIDEMCDWYQAVAEVPAILWTADDLETQDTLWTEDDTLPEGVEVGDIRWAAFQTVGDVKEAAYTVKESIVLGDKSIGDAITFTSNGTEYTGTIVKEDDVKHTKSKVSDTADSKKVYGVFSSWDDADDGLDGDVNDMNIAQVGTFIIRVNADVTVEAGDLLVSNGDGTAKLQDDDIIRSKTVAKVNSNIKVETYADGSYTVPCTLHC